MMKTKPMTEAVADATLKRWTRNMKRKLMANAHKGDSWLGDEPLALLRRVREELDELEMALINGDPREEVSDESADVANMAMMVHDAYWLGGRATHDTEKAAPFRKGEPLIEWSEPGGR